MYTLQTFDFNENQVRTVLIGEEPWFVGKDICDVLELSNNRKALSTIDEEDKRSVTISYGTSGNPNMTVVNESGLYQLIFKSQKEEAKQFKRWVTKEVLPTIRKTGSYNVEQKTQYEQLPPHKQAEERAETMAKLAERISKVDEELMDQPRLAQFLKDQMINPLLSNQSQKELDQPKLRGVAEIAEEMGYSVNHQNRTILGRFVSEQCSHLAQEEERLCNGTTRKIKCYPDCEEVRDAIKLFFNR